MTFFIGYHDFAAPYGFSTLLVGLNWVPCLVSFIGFVTGLYEAELNMLSCHVSRLIWFVLVWFLHVCVVSMDVRSLQKSAQEFLIFRTIWCFMTVCCCLFTGSFHHSFVASYAILWLRKWLLLVFCLVSLYDHDPRWSKLVELICWLAGYQILIESMWFIWI